jgi:hypothetical protein
MDDLSADGERRRSHPVEPRILRRGGAARRGCRAARDVPKTFNLGIGHRQLTDVYLLAMAVRHGGRLGSFDRSIVAKAVRGARPEHLVVVDA